MLDDLFFVEEDKPKKDTTPTSNTPQQNKTKKISDTDIYRELEARAKNQGIKKSIFSIIEEDILKDIGNMIEKKQMSYNIALKKLKELYPLEEKIVKLKSSNSLRYFLISKGYIYNEKALETINKSISKSGFAKSKRQRIIKDVIEDLVENYSEELINNPKFQESLLNNESFILKLREKILI